MRLWFVSFIEKHEYLQITPITLKDEKWKKIETTQTNGKANHIQLDENDRGAEVLDIYIQVQKKEKATGSGPPERYE